MKSGHTLTQNAGMETHSVQAGVSGGRGETFEDLADSKVLPFFSVTAPSYSLAFVQVLGLHPACRPYQCPVKQASGP